MSNTITHFPSTYIYIYIYACLFFLGRNRSNDKYYANLYMFAIFSYVVIPIIKPDLIMWILNSIMWIHFVLVMLYLNKFERFCFQSGFYVGF